MARSVLRLPRVDKHQRLFELIRQDNLRKQIRPSVTAEPATAEMQALRARAEKSIRP